MPFADPVSRPAGAPVAIVGASTAGLLTSIRLAESGRAVRLYERSRSPEAAERTLIVTGELLDVAGDVARGAVRNQIDSFEIIAGRRRLEIPLSRPDLVIERSALVADLVARAEEAGVDLRWGRSFAGLELRGDDLYMLVGGDGTPLRENKVSTLVGADGMSSRVAGTLRWPRPARLSLIQAIVRMPEGSPAHVSKVWFEPDRTPYFFWLVPESSTRAAVGVISEDGRSARPVLDEFLARQRFQPLTYQAARIPGYDRWIPPYRKVGNSEVYLVGDAAGHVKVTTVGGIVNGFRGAEAVADAIANGYSRRRFKPLKRELDAHLWVRKLLHRLDTSEYETLLKLFNRPLTRRAGVTSRDQPVRMIAQSLLAQPRLVSFGARAAAHAALARTRPEGREDLPAAASPRPSWGSLKARPANESLESAR